MFDQIASVYFSEKYIIILALEMASPGNQHCASCIGTLAFPLLLRRFLLTQSNALQLGTTPPPPPPQIPFPAAAPTPNKKKRLSALVDKKKK